MSNYQSLWTKANGSQLPIIAERIQSDIELPVAPGKTPEITLISGSLPPGTRLEGATIKGTPFEVPYDTIFTAVFRAERDDIIDDCTLLFVVAGPDTPTWVTNKGLLPVGTNDAYYILDNAIIDFQLIAVDSDTLAGVDLKYFIAEGGGALPPGITLTQEGRLYGIVEPLLALDKLYVDAGYDEQPYANLPMDYASRETMYYDIGNVTYSVPLRNRKKLNRYYAFAVTVTDGITFINREFRIYVVGDDFFTADNTAMQVSNGVFTADNSSVRTPVWITPADLGYKRASNYITIYMETVNSPDLTGMIVYTQDLTNPGVYQLNTTGEIVNNGYYDISRIYPYFPKAGRQTTSASEWTVITAETTSTLPPGLSLDKNAGIISGRIPFQPAITKPYQFTIRATRFSDVNGYVEVYGSVYEDTMSGNSSFKIGKIDLTGTQDGITDTAALHNQDIILNNRSYRILTIDNSNPEYDVVNLSTSLDPAVVLNVSQSSKIDTDYLFIDRLNETDKQKCIKRQLIFSNTESYIISDIVPYLTYNIVKTNNTPIDEIIAKMETKFGGKIYATAVTANQWQLKMISSVQSKHIPTIKSYFGDSPYTEVTIVRDNEDRVLLDRNWFSVVQYPRTLGIAAIRGDYFSKLLETSRRDDINTPTKAKTFNVNVIGEIDSSITWITPSYLGTINANFVSTLKVEASTTVPESAMVYTIVKGKLPHGMTLNYRGGIFGRANQYAEGNSLGLTRFDNNTAFWDRTYPTGTTFDRQYKFTVKAEDRFKLVAVEREFVLDVADLDNNLYTDVYVKPMLKIQQRQIYTSFISNTAIFDYTKIYRPSDSNFGLQRELQMLVYAGIEATNLEQYIAAAAKNHKRKRFYLGDFKKAVAKEPGTNEVVYEVIYLEVIDPAEPTVGKARNEFTIQTPNIFTVDSRASPRSIPNAVKADSDAIKVSNSKDQTRYISNITNMRDQIKGIGNRERNYLPLWMRTPQADFQVLNYITAVPVCYCLPGTGDTILLNINNHIKNTNFSIQHIDFEIDRYIIQRTDSTNQEQHVVFANYQFNV